MEMLIIVDVMLLILIRTTTPKRKLTQKQPGNSLWQPFCIRLRCFVLNWNTRASGDYFTHPHGYSYIRPKPNFIQKYLAYFAAILAQVPVLVMYL